MNKTLVALCLVAFLAPLFADAGVTTLRGYNATASQETEHQQRRSHQPAEPYTGNYYDDLNKDKITLQSLHNLVSKHEVLSYDGVWAAFPVIDDSMDSGCSADNKIADVYSNMCFKVGKVPEGQQCGNFHQEGDCYNREHGWPKSWWGGFGKGKGAQTDLFSLWPTDGYVNGRRGNLPLGIVKTAEYTSFSGALVGKCEMEGYTGRCFEVPDEYKGDFARSYFYIATAYMGKFACCNTAGTDGSNIKPWMETILRKWHKLDPPSKQEMIMNNIIESKFQHNRSPYIDHPEWVDLIGDF